MNQSLYGLACAYFKNESCKRNRKYGWKIRDDDNDLNLAFTCMLGSGLGVPIENKVRRCKIT